MNIRTLLAIPRVRVLLAALLLFGAWQAWLTLSAPGKIAPALLGKPRVDVVVVLPFPPERFHVLAFQRYGRVTGTEGNAVELRGVRQGDLAGIARRYWVSRIDPMEED